MILTEPSNNVPRYLACCKCDILEDIEFDSPIVLTLKIYKPGTIRVKTLSDKKFFVEGDRRAFDFNIVGNE